MIPPSAEDVGANQSPQRDHDGALTSALANART
jgi:hypothetical protein